MARDLDALSDDELLALAEQSGIPTEEFGIPSITIPQSTRDLVSREFAPVREQMFEDLTRGAIAAAGRRGLEFSDTPIAEPFLRSLALGTSKIGGAEAGKTLELGVQNREFLEAARRFQNDLNQQAFVNRLNLGEQFGRTGLGLNVARFGRGTGGQTVNPAQNALAQSLMTQTGGRLLGTGITDVGLTGVGLTGFFN
jgi:hypothetical protein|tara:strand:+ start:1292 stop:1882 length:591 start_codon:yes stop_codon:yes gene_type:complete